MVEHELTIRVRYAETDQMGYVYYGNYAAYFEVARVEMFRKIGMSYKAMEELGVGMPVLEFNTKYIRPAKYDDLLKVKISIPEKPGLRIHFDYEVYNEANDLLTKASTKLVFINLESGRPTPPPLDFLDLLSPYFE